MNAPAPSIATEHLMTPRAPIAGAPQRIGDTLTVFHSGYEVFAVK